MDKCVGCSPFFFMVKYIRATAQSRKERTEKNEAEKQIKTKTQVDSVDRIGISYGGTVCIHICRADICGA